MIYIHKIITSLSLHLVPKIPLTCLNVKIIILSDIYDTVTLPRHWMESNSKRLNWVSHQIHTKLRILIFLFHTVTDIDCDQKWITHDSQCKFIQSKDSEEDLTTALSNLTMQSSFYPSRMWPGCTIIFHARMALKSAWSPFKGRESAFSPKTLPKLISLPSPSVPLPKTLIITHKDPMTVFWKKSTHLQASSPTPAHINPWHCWTYASCIFYTHLPSQ